MSSGRSFGSTSAVQRTMMASVGAIERSIDLKVESADGPTVSYHASTLGMKRMLGFRRFASAKRPTMTCSIGCNSCQHLTLLTASQTRLTLPSPMTFARSMFCTCTPSSWCKTADAMYSCPMPALPPSRSRGR
jgi:hypothetical protein